MSSGPEPAIPGSAVPAAGAGSAVALRSVVHLYPSAQGDVVALRGVDLTVSPGTSVALLGPSGAGKSTVIGLLAGTFAASAGQVLVGGEDVGRMGAARLNRYRALDVSLVVQGATNNLLGYATVAENLWFAQRGAAAHGRALAMSPGELLEVFGVAELAERPCASLTPGAQQLAALVAGVAPLPGLLLLDEPTSRLEPGARDRVLEAIGTLTSRFPTTVVLVTHDAVVAGSVGRTITIRDGRVGSEGLDGADFAVVAPDGSLQLPPEALGLVPPGSLVTVAVRDDHVELRPRER